ncbi:MAG: peptide ABC transporter substrate-binding protein [Gemmatimonadota bacterium]|nr:peptide ABC transporter substrate-binding protein [Gemmatimonadota bacterium]
MITFVVNARAAAAALILACAACGPPPRPPGVLVYASGSDLESGNPLVTVHPLSRQVQRYALFVTLARYDSALAPEPYAARRWEWSGDRRTLTVYLHPDVRWHDGRPTTAHDAAFTIDAARDPATGYLRASDLVAIRDATGRDDTTLVVRFATPQPAFPSVLAELPILPRHLLADVPRAAMRRAPFSTAPVGNGPFRFASRRDGQRWVFVRNAAFPEALGGPPKAAGLVVAVVDEATTKFAGLASGDLDFAGISPSMASLAKRDPSMRVVDYPVLFSTALVFNVAKPPFDDARVRRAIGLAIDRERIVHVALAGYGIPAEGPVPPENPLAAGGTPLLDVVRADSLFDAAGWRRGASGARERGGRRLTFELLTVGSGDNALEQLVQDDLAARGVRVEIRQVEMGAFLTAAREKSKRFDVLQTGIPGDLSLAYLAAMYDSRQAGSALDYGGYHTRTLDVLFAALRQARDAGDINRTWRSIQAELAREAPAVWIYHSRGLVAMSSRVRNVQMDLRGELATVARWELGGEDDPADHSGAGIPRHSRLAARPSQ